jgi:hypothetical protein
MISKYLHNDIHTTDKSDGPRVGSSTAIAKKNYYMWKLIFTSLT